MVFMAAFILIQIIKMAFAGSFVMLNPKHLRYRRRYFSDSESKEVDMQFVLLSIDVAETTVT
jgi:hypothetical protein